MQLASSSELLQLSGSHGGVAVPSDFSKPYMWDLDRALNPGLDNPDLSSLFSEKREHFSAAEIVALCCRHAREAVEVSDSKIRTKRLKELSRELSNTMSYKLLYQKRPDVWDMLKKIVEPLIDAEGKTKDGEPTRNEQVYESMLQIVGQLAQLSVDKDYFYESMLMDIQSLESALYQAHQTIVRAAQRIELLENMAKARNSQQIQHALEDARMMANSTEAAAAVRMAALFKELDEAIQARDAEAERNRLVNASSSELHAKIAELERELRDRGREVQELKRKLEEERRKKKELQEKVKRMEEAMQEERRKVLASSEGANVLEQENERLRKEIAELHAQLRQKEVVHEQKNEVQRELEKVTSVMQSVSKERDSSRAELEKEKEMRKRADKHIVELRADVKAIRDEKIRLMEHKRELELSKEGLKKDLDNERTWRTEWKVVHEQVKDAVQRLYQADPPAVVDERSHQVMAMLQERIASESHARGLVADLENRLHRETSGRLLLERRLAALQAEMLDMRVRAARGDMPLEDAHYDAKPNSPPQAPAYRPSPPWGEDIVEGVSGFGKGDGDYPGKGARLLRGSAEQEEGRRGGARGKPQEDLASVYGPSRIPRVGDRRNQAGRDAGQNMVRGYG